MNSGRIFVPLRDIGEIMNGEIVRRVAYAISAAGLEGVQGRYTKESVEAFFEKQARAAIAAYEEAKAEVALQRGDLGRDVAPVKLENAFVIPCPRCGNMRSAITMFAGCKAEGCPDISATF
jgi:hypothetical protein